jgi:hypothetical protein
MATLAEVFISIRPDTRRIGPEVSQAAEKAGDKAGQQAGHSFGQSMTKAIKAAGIGLAIAGTFVGVKAFGFLKDAVADASALNETISKSQQIFPNTQDVINKFAENARTALGVSRQQALESAASFGNFFNQIGITEKKSAEMSTTILQLAADLGSFNNADPSQVMESFLSATRGEFDSLQRFIPTVNAAKIQTEALAITHKKSAKDLTDADKAMALYRIALRDAGKAQGDFARTAAGLANSQRTFKASMADIRGEIGQALLPTIARLYGRLNSELVPVLNELWQRHGPAVTAFLEKWVTKIEQLDLGKLIDDVKGFFASLRDGKGDGADTSKNLAEMAKSGKELLPVIKEFISSLPSLADVINVANVALKFFADHADLLAKLMPVIIALFIAWQAAQAAGNIAMLVSIPVKIAEVTVNRQLVKSNQALIASRSGLTAVTVAGTGATVAGTAAENVGIFTRIRATASMVAAKVAMVAVRAATLAWIAVQTVLNFVLTANPIGIIVIAIAALVAGFIYAYKHSDKFREIVDNTFRAVRVAIEAVVNWIRDVAWPFIVAYFQFWISAPGKVFDFLVSWGARIIGWITGFRDKLVGGAVAMWDAFIQTAKNAINKLIDIWNSLDLGLSIGPIPDWVPTIGGKRFTIPDLFPDIPRLAQGGVIDPRPGGTLAVLAEAGTREIATPEDLMRRMIAEAVAAGGRGDVTVKMVADNPAIAAFFKLLRLVVDDAMDARERQLAAGVRL